MNSFNLVVDTIKQFYPKIKKENFFDFIDKKNSKVNFLAKHFINDNDFT